jgi:hypothetical protein
MGRARTVTFSQTLVTEECYLCGVLFAMPDDLRAQLLAHHDRSFYCPNGHGQHYTGPTEAERMRAQRDELARELASAHEDTRAARAAHAVTKAQLSRARKRADAGVCQHCHRSFQNVARHVARQHPELSQAHA